MSSTAAARRVQAGSLVPLNEHPRWVAACEKVRALEERCARAEARAQSARARIRAKTGVLRSEGAEAELAGIRRADDEAKARALSEGREIGIPLPPQFDAEAADEEIRLLTPLLVEARAERDAVQCELDAEASALVTAAKRAADLALDRALEELHRAHDASIDPLVKLQGFGYRPNHNVVPVFNLPHVAVLGDPDRPESIAGRFRSWLREYGSVR